MKRKEKSLPKKSLSESLPEGLPKKSLSEMNLDTICAGKTFYPSPAAWEDQVLYFLMLDRFSDGKEKGFYDNSGSLVSHSSTPMYRMEDFGNATRTAEDRGKWVEAGEKFVGGNLKGLESKIGYLKRLGVTAVWMSPIFRQVAFKETYHGYGIQNFLDVDPRFGTREDLKNLVNTAHENGIRVILDIILNHTGDVFGYDEEKNRYWSQGEDGNWYIDYRWDGNPYQVKGFKNESGQPVIPFKTATPDEAAAAWPDGAIWPAEFQSPDFFTKKGHINNWEYWPEYLEGDFCDLKDVSHGFGGVDHYHGNATLMQLCDIYKFWIAYADIDGFRMDTVKHMDMGATRIFTSAIHEFAQSIGKENFYLIGEITGGREKAFDTLEETGLNAALGINDIPDKLEYMVKGYRNPSEYFELFRNSILVKKDSHIWFRNKVVTMFDDHDQVRKGKHKARFCADHDASKVLLSVLALNATTMGIPCIYYGSEQYFNGHGDNDRYLREAMFGGEFGAFESRDRHFFNEENFVYKELSKILKIRNEIIALRRGRQYLRPISGDGENFGLPHIIGHEMRSVIPWSRIFNDHEVMLAINTDYYQPKTAWVTIDNSLHKAGDKLKCIYSTDKGQEGKEVSIEERNGKAVKITVPEAGFVIFR
jgi:glycosidase